jgi:hypothetical protein
MGDITKAPEYQAGVQWVLDRAFPDAPDWMEIYREASRRYPEKKHSYVNYPKWNAFVVGAAQSRLEARDPEARVAIERFTEGWKRTTELHERGEDPNPPPPPGTGRTVHYMSVINPGPLVIIRTPFPLPRWKDVLKAITPVMQSHNLRRKDISEIEGLTRSPEYPFTDEEFRFAERLDAAFEGDPNVLPEFWLYDWTKGRFSLVREPTRSPKS